MKVLAIDTSGTSSGVALAVDGEVVAATAVAGAKSHSTQLFAQIESALKVGNLEKAELDGVAVTVGPGSFTGLRVGVATAKGIAAGLNIKVAGVSTLVALANCAGVAEGVVAPLLDARMGQVYAAAFDLATGEALVAEGAWAPQDFAQALVGLGRDCFLIGSGIGPYEEIFSTALGTRYQAAQREHWDIDPAAVASLGSAALERGEGVRAEELAPVYHRKSQAQMQRKRAGTK